MSNLSDKEIDRLSREAADSFEPDHSSLSWSRLEQMLTEQMPERPPDGFRFDRINPYIWGPAVVLFAGISFYLIKTKMYSQNSTRTSQSAIKPATSPPAEKSSANGMATYADSSSLSSDASASKSRNENVTDTKKPLSPTAKNKQVLANTADAVRTLSGNGNESGARSLNGLSIRSNTAAKINSGKKVPVSNSMVPASWTAAGTAPDVLSNSSGTGAQNKNRSKEAALPSSAVFGITSAGRYDAKTDNSGLRNPLNLPSTVNSGSVPGQVTGNDSLLNRISSVNTPVPHKSLHINRSLNFGFALGPDYTDAGGISNNQFGNNIGLTVGYYLTNKLSVNTGIFYSNKFFWSPGYGPGNPAQQGPPGGGYIANSTFAAPTIEYVNGAFNLYQLPLSLRYDFAKSDKSKFFVNAGFSSYFIINQAYIYFSHSGYRPSAWKRTDNSQQNYWFGTGDLSFGIETDMGKGFSFQAEPFLNLPLKQMGLENVKLKSYGIMLSFRYAPVLSRRKK